LFVSVVFGFLVSVTAIQVMFFMFDGIFTGGLFLLLLIVFSWDSSLK